MSGLAESQRAFERTLYFAAAGGLAVGGVIAAWRPAIGGGFILGAAAGAAAYLWMARMLPRLGEIPREDLQLYTVRQAAGRLGIYAVAIVLAYKLDPVRKLGVLAALAGYLFIRAAATYAAWRMAQRATQRHPGDLQ